jgi:hypothetical protein
MEIKGRRLVRSRAVLLAQDQLTSTYIGHYEETWQGRYLVPNSKTESKELMYSNACSKEPDMLCPKPSLLSTVSGYIT